MAAWAEENGVEFRPFTFHHLRHKHAILWLRNGGNIYELQQRLGHSSIKQTEEYLKYLNPDQQRKIPTASARPGDRSPQKSPQCWGLFRFEMREVPINGGFLLIAPLWQFGFCRPLRNHSATWPHSTKILLDQIVVGASFVLFNPCQTHETRTKTVQVPPQIPPANPGGPSHYMGAAGGSMAQPRPEADEDI